MPHPCEDGIERIGRERDKRSWSTSRTVVERRNHNNRASSSAATRSGRSGNASRPPKVEPNRLKFDRPEFAHGTQPTQT
ncbi:hypothetical protein CTE05_25560 [Cellulomonas terrae]|uniref:Uncharacterized protein n=1 Tax=Cellulomonas terrae TaxID=311234 RepID=A0A511JM64_9CELL|nr:hypothetical protein CTE05_25560 [Cellulomonas terrae]